MADTRYVAGGMLDPREQRAADVSRVRLAVQQLLGRTRAVDRHDRSASEVLK